MSRFGYPNVLALIMSGLTALLLSSCGSNSSSPVAATPPTVAPTPTPTPTPAPTPTPTPTPAPTPTPTPTPSMMTITITGENGGMSFSPSAATVKVGQQIVWHNSDAITHTATSGSFDTGALGPGSTSQPITLSAAAMINYHCSIHPSMVGTLNVTQ